MDMRNNIEKIKVEQVYEIGGILKYGKFYVYIGDRYVPKGFVESVFGVYFDNYALIDGELYLSVSGDYDKYLKARTGGLELSVRVSVATYTELKRRAENEERKRKKIRYKIEHV